MLMHDWYEIWRCSGGQQCWNWPFGGKGIQNEILISKGLTMVELPSNATDLIYQTVSGYPKCQQTIQYWEQLMQCTGKILHLKSGSVQMTQCSSSERMSQKVRSSYITEGEIYVKSYVKLDFTVCPTLSPLFQKDLGNFICVVNVWKICHTSLIWIVSPASKTGSQSFEANSLAKTHAWVVAGSWLASPRCSMEQVDLVSYEPWESFYHRGWCRAQLMIICFEALLYLVKNFSFTGNCPYFCSIDLACMSSVYLCCILVKICGFSYWNVIACKMCAPILCYKILFLVSVSFWK
jgi:hypothetical protein